MQVKMPSSQIGNQVLQIKEQRMDMKLNIDKQLKSAYPKDKIFNGKYDENCLLHHKNFLFLCESYEIATETISRWFGMTLDESSLTLLDAHFVIDHVD